MKVAIFGGSFDPVHFGHLLMAEQCLDALGLDRVVFVPAAIPPHKQEMELTRPENRLDMLRLAIGGHDRFAIDTCELDRDGVSYTVDTLRHFRDEMPEAELFFLMGADSLDEFHTWKDPEEICSLATPLAINRPGLAEVDYQKLEPFASQETLDIARSASYVSCLVDISSSEIRERIQSRKSIRYQTPRAVEQYIYEKKLYQEA